MWPYMVSFLLKNCGLRAIKKTSTGLVYVITLKHKVMIGLDDYTRCFWEMAEREGFEPSIELPLYCISSAAH